MKFGRVKSGQIPEPSPLENMTPVPFVLKCAYECCDRTECRMFSYQETTGCCLLYSQTPHSATFVPKDGYEVWLMKT